MVATFFGSPPPLLIAAMGFLVGFGVCAILVFVTDHLTMPTASAAWRAGYHKALSDTEARIAAMKEEAA